MERNLIRKLNLNNSESINLNEYEKPKSLLDKVTIMIDYSKTAKREYAKQHKVLIQTLNQLNSLWFKYAYIKNLLKDLNHT